MLNRGPDCERQACTGPEGLPARAISKGVALLIPLKVRWENGSVN